METRDGSRELSTATRTRTRRMTSITLILIFFIHVNLVFHNAFLL